MSRYIPPMDQTNLAFMGETMQGSLSLISKKNHPKVMITKSCAIYSILFQEDMLEEKRLAPHVKGTLTKF